MIDEKKLIASINELLRNQPAELGEDEIYAHICSYFDRADEFISLTKDNTLPLYIVDAAAIGSRVKDFNQAFSQLKSAKVYYPVKTNSCPLVLSEMINNGCGIEVSSGRELKEVLALGCDDIIFNGPGKLENELQLAIENSSKVRVLVDSFGELELLGPLVDKAGRDMRIGVRITAGPAWKKFGIPPYQLGEFITECEKYSRIRFSGVQFHTSWNMEPSAQVAMIESLGGVIKSLSPQQQAMIEFVDIGGGFWPEQGEWLTFEGTTLGRIAKELAPQDIVDDTRNFKIPACKIEHFADSITAALRKNIFTHIDCDIYLEPGRWLINGCMHLLLEVVDIKDGGQMVITSGGINAIGWERFEIDYCPILNLTRPAATQRSCEIVGSLCTPHDIWGKAYWGESIAKGDILLIPDQGAYTFSLRQEFIKPLPQCVLINGNS